MAVCAAAVSADFAAGRETSAFYSQMAGASWLGIAFSALLFGGLVALIVLLARRSGARDLFSLLRRSPGGALGRIGRALYLGILLLAGGSLICAAGRLGALTLPLRHAYAFGVAAALLLAAWLALGGAGGMRIAGAGFVALLALYEAALARFGRLDELPGMQFVLELKLADNLPAALLFGALHAAMCASLCAGVVLRAAGEGARPAALGLWSGSVFFLLTAAGNAALRAQAGELLALEVPFVALASGWGAAGFWSSAAVIYLAAVTSLAGLICALPLPDWMLNSKISRGLH